jgi:Fe-S cluster biogenesis protein NfuA
MFGKRKETEEKEQAPVMANAAEENAPETAAAAEMPENAEEQQGEDINLKEHREEIENALHDIRQILQTDGGDIELVDITDDNVVKVRLLGHCVGCYAAQMTMQGIVEQILSDSVPGVQGVEAVM